VVDVRPAHQAQPRWARARRVTLWSRWAPRVPRLQGSHGVTELLMSSERVCAKDRAYTFMSHVYVCGPLCERGLVVAPDLPYTTVGICW
jgi:hypothetical protein